MVLLAVVVTDVLRTWSQERERVMNQIRTRAALGKGIRRVAKSFSGSFSDNPNSAYKVWKKHPVTRNLLLLIMFVLLFAAIFVSVEDSINYGNCIYFAVVASTTVGYGDVHPNTFAAKWAIILLLPPSVYLVSSTLSDIASFILDNNPQSNDGGENVLLTDSHVLDQQKDLSAKGLLEWSKSNHRNVNGGISEGDYLQFILSQSQLIDEDVIKKLRDKFAGMDESRSGVINKTELEHLTEESPLRSFGSSDDRLSVDSLTASDSLNMLTINYEVQPVGDASDV
jgi:hypothetical protein